MRGKKINWSNVTQGKLTVLREVGKNKHGSILWECLCSCGAVVNKSSDVLKAEGDVAKWEGKAKVRFWIIVSLFLLGLLVGLVSHLNILCINA